MYIRSCICTCPKLTVAYTDMTFVLCYFHSTKRPPNQLWDLSQSFLKLYCTQSYGCTHGWFNHSPLYGHLGCFQCSIISNEATMNFCTFYWVTCIFKSNLYLLYVFILAYINKLFVRCIRCITNIFFIVYFSLHFLHGIFWWTEFKVLMKFILWMER